MSLNTAARRTAAIGVAALLLVVPVAAHADAPPAPENSAGILALLDAGGAVLASGSTTAQPGFTAALASAPCPAGFADAARVSMVPADGQAVVISATVPLFDPAVPANVPVAAVLADYAPGSGATVMLECLAVQGGIPLPAATVFSVGLSISGSDFAVVPAPVLPTQPPVEPTAPATIDPTVSPSSGATDGTTDVATGSASGPTTTGALDPAATGGSAAEGQGGDGLASTGATLMPMLLGAGLLSAAGAGALLWRRSRATHV